MERFALRGRRRGVRAAVVLAVAAIAVVTVAAVVGMVRATSGTSGARIVESGDWTSIPTDAAGLGDASHFSSVATAGDAVLLAGATGSGGDSRAAMWRSTDGLTWSSVTVPRESGRVAAVAARGSTVLAVGATGPDTQAGTARFVWRSDDGGAHWTTVTSGDDVFGPPAPEMGRPATIGLLWHDGYWVAYGLGSDGYEGVWTSRDGATWNQISLDGYAGSATVISAPDGDLLGYWGNIVWRSTDDPTRWTSGTGLTLPPDLLLTVIAPGMDVAFGDHIETHGQPTPLLRSSDAGRTWSIDDRFLQQNPDAIVSTVIRLDGTYVAAGTSGDLSAPRPDAWVSSDGATWTAMPSELRGEPAEALRLMVHTGTTTLLLGATASLDRYYLLTH
jgi:hypothetical protein